MGALGWLLAGPAGAQTARPALEIYHQGPVWHMIKVRTAPGQQNAYLQQLAGTWSRQVRLAEEMGFVLDHHVLTKWPADPADWDVLIIEIFPNMASYDTFLENWARVDAAVLPAEEREGGQVDLNAIRTTLGVQIAREVRFKSAPQSPAIPPP
ncbi:MAG TPA: hypothetical protein VF981_07335 [Gemmatimonadaceae bacterium]